MSKDILADQKIFFDYFKNIPKRDERTCSKYLSMVLDQVFLTKRCIKNIQSSELTLKLYQEYLINRFFAHLRDFHPRNIF